MKLVVKTNNVTTRENCAICGFFEKFADVPYWVFTKKGAVCHNCTKKHEPILLEVVEKANRYVWQNEWELETEQEEIIF